MPGESIPGLPECGDSIDAATFGQILEMDDDEDDREFSKEIVLGFLDQAVNTFGEMDNGLKNKDLPTLSSLGHFLKGSSATLGLTQMKKSCEMIQHWGNLKDETGMEPKDEAYCLNAIKLEVAKLRKEFVTVERALKTFYGEPA